MTHPKPTTIFFAGTDTEVGKTYTAALAARFFRDQEQRVGVYKPVASGCAKNSAGQLVAEDALALWEAAGQPGTLADVCPQKFSQPLAPPAAAAAEGKAVDAALLHQGAERWKTNVDVLLVEGAGGLFSPLADGMLNIDLAKHFKAKLVIVAANRLGVIHQTIATCAAATHHGIKPHGLILCSPACENDESVASNAEQIQRYCDVPLVGCVPFGGGPRHLKAIGAWLD